MPIINNTNCESSKIRVFLLFYWPLLMAAIFLALALNVAFQPLRKGRRRRDLYIESVFHNDSTVWSGLSY